MTTLNIAPDQWRDELDSFSRQHEGWIVSVTTRSPNGTVQIEAQNLPLQGVSQASPNANRINIDVGGRQGHLSHEVENVAAMSIDLTADRAERALVLESADGTTTTVAFRSPTRPEEVDGLSAEPE